jgi:hypothetical protein
MKKLSILAALLLLTLSAPIASATSYPDGCTATTKYSATTGHLCLSLNNCAPGDLYSQLDGHKCGATTQTAPVAPILTQPSLNCGDLYNGLINAATQQAATKKSYDQQIANEKMAAGVPQPFITATVQKLQAAEQDYMTSSNQNIANLQAQYNVQNCSAVEHVTPESLIQQNSGAGHSTSA